MTRRKTRRRGRLSKQAASVGEFFEWTLSEITPAFLFLPRVTRISRKIMENSRAFVKFAARNFISEGV